MKWEAKYLNKLKNTILRVVRNYYYPHRYWIDYTINLSRTYTNTILKLLRPIKIMNRLFNKFNG